MRTEKTEMVQGFAVCTFHRLLWCKIEAEWRTGHVVRI